ncbi:MAG: hypothetical protein ABSB26_04545 [Nitrososphaerales archaeon]|jgi:hypothetical protein
MLYEEVWESRFPRRQTIEEELLTLQALAPDTIEDLHPLFKAAVIDSLVSILGESGARAVVILMAGTNFESPSGVYAALDSIFQEGSRFLRRAIVEEFSVNLHLLLERVEKIYS